MASLMKEIIQFYVSVQFTILYKSSSKNNNNKYLIHNNNINENVI